jgi:phosphoribosylaminoimidazole-succinocarboxamide synthase
MDKEVIMQHLDRVLESTDFKGIGEKYKGKVRDVYGHDDKLILVATDRYSAFDRNLALIPFKGQVLTQISLFWFDKTKDIIQNHVLDNPDPNVVVGKKCTMIPIEVIVRGFITGVTDTAMWTIYQKGQRDFGDFVLPDGMKKNQKLQIPMLTPTTKDAVHDRPISGKEIVAEKIVEEKLWGQIEQVAKALFTRGQEIASKQGLILVDTKYEFGLDSDGKLILIDEIHTPDSSRYWMAASYEARIAQGLEPEYFDKEFLRLWFKENSDPYKDEKLPDAPPDMVAELSSRYIQIYEQLTGKTFEADFDTPILERIQKNLEKYWV